jgi:hypothetical protein
MSQREPLPRNKSDSVVSDNPPTGTLLPQLWALLDAHRRCVIDCRAAAEGWLIDGVSVPA